MMKPELSIGPLSVGPVPLVVGVISSERTLRHLAEVSPPPFDIAEFRIDLIGVEAEGWFGAASRLTESGRPVILTIRHRHEGGRWYRDDVERLRVYEGALPYVAAVDIEIGSEIAETLASLAREQQVRVIGSFHDFEATPDSVTLGEIMVRGQDRGADIVKIATFINHEKDVVRLANLLAEYPAQHMCLLGMGPLGAETRVSLPLAGSCLTYGFVDESSAPGQLSSAKLRERLMAESELYREFALKRVV